MAPHQRSTEKGQALVLIVLGIVVLLGFTALAIDGGMAYADRRYAQNAADAASLAGGAAAAQHFEANHVTYENFSCSSSVVKTGMSKAVAAAINRASANGFALDNNITDKHGVKAECHITADYFADKYIDIILYVGKETKTSLIHFVYQGPVKNTVTATTRIRLRTNLAFGNAIVSTNQSACSGNKNGVIFSGSSTSQVTGGGIFSNGCLSGNGTGFSVDVYGGHSVGYAGSVDGTTSNINPSPVKINSTMPPDTYTVAPPDCSQVPNYGSPVTKKNVSGHVPAGNYTEVSLKGDVTLEGGGLYCMKGDFDTGNANVWINESTGKGVTFYLESGSFITSGNGSVVLSAPPLWPDPEPALAGILIYLAPGNTGIVKLRGNSTSEYLGVILAPDGRIDLAGTEDVNKTFHTQLIGKDVEVTGNALVDIQFNGGIQHQIPARVSLFQ